MVAVRWFKIFSLLILMFLLRGTIEQHSTADTVRAGQDVTLHCKYVTQKQHECYSTTWIFSDSASSVALYQHGQIDKDAKNKSDRLSVTANCSLVIKKVTSEDAGRYTCRQFKTKGGPQEGPDSVVYLSVINSEDVKTTKSPIANLMTTMKSPSSTSNITNTQMTSVKIKTSGGTLTKTPNNPAEESLLRCIIVSVGLAALLISFVTVNMWTKAKEKKTQMEENRVLNDEDEGPGGHENIRDPSASVRFH